MWTLCPFPIISQTLAVNRRSSCETHYQHLSHSSRITPEDPQRVIKRPICEVCSESLYGNADLQQTFQIESRGHLAQKAEANSPWRHFLYGRQSLWYVFGPGTHLTVLGQPTAAPTVHLFHPSQEEIKSRKKATLVCLMDNFYPGAVQVDWLADGTAVSSGVETTKPTKQGEKYVASSYLTLDQADWESHSTYTCKVRHEGKDFEKVVMKSSCA
ncbi:hypothetical protein JRQ81_007697 [Phrynocephalus forsythii]|uniref:Ig-like domain-containing protein n=1 Tax=Phrynocephalus forsythii TaxID=171643 RepID=A0A9Q0XD02_9SAUR|nr:hypothetical protein JRQ81_007697 [Phrynocephalus forsythii]